MHLNRQQLTLLPLLLIATFLSGCVQIETRIQLRPDGGAVITERVRFSQALLDLGDKGEPRYSQLLSKEAIQDRMKQMGKNVRLVSHEVRDAEGASRESLTVFQVEDVNDFRYASPFLAYADYPQNNLVQYEMVPLLKSCGNIGTAGEMAISLKPLKPPRAETRATGTAKGPTPRELQALRQLQPVFADLLKGFKVRLTFESYSPITGTGFGWRDRRAGTHQIDWLNVTDRDLDRHGVNILENEEIVLDLLRGRFSSENIAEAVRPFQDNHTVPLFLNWGSPHSLHRVSDEIYFQPSRALFDKHFAGKTLDFSRGRNSQDLRPARFEELGWQPKSSGKDKEPR